MPIAVENESGPATDFYGSGNSEWLKDEGVYHFIVMHATDVPLDKNSAQIVNGMMQFQLAVVGGSSKDKLFEQTFFNNKPDASDKQKAMQKRQLMRIAYACNLAGNAEVLAGKLMFEPKDMEGQQLIMRVAFGEKDGKKTNFLQMHYSDVWHIDDPDAPKDCIIDATAIKTIPAARRRKADYFNELKEKLKPGSGNGSSGGGSNGGGNSTQGKSETPAPKKKLSDL